jgi:hypothetical protein
MPMELLDFFREALGFHGAQFENHYCTLKSVLYSRIVLGNIYIILR